MENNDIIETTCVETTPESETKKSNVAQRLLKNKWTRAAVAAAGVVVVAVVAKSVINTEETELESEKP